LWANKKPTHGKTAMHESCYQAFTLRQARLAAANAVRTIVLALAHHSSPSSASGCGKHKGLPKRRKLLPHECRTLPAEHNDCLALWGMKNTIHENWKKSKKNEKEK
jgi:hypothetical protein